MSITPDNVGELGKRIGRLVNANVDENGESTLPPGITALAAGLVAVEVAMNFPNTGAGAGRDDTELFNQAQLWGGIDFDLL